MTFYYFSHATEQLALLWNIVVLLQQGTKQNTTTKGLNSPGKSFWVNPFAHLFAPPPRKNIVIT